MFARRIYGVLPYAGFTPALRRVWGLALCMGLYGGVVYALERRVDFEGTVVPHLVELVLGFALATLLIFRINRSYERWWEARTLWGKLVNISRNLAIKVHVLTKPQDPERAKVGRLIIGFCYALKDHLRSGAWLQAVPGFEQSNQNPQHVPVWLAQGLYAQFQAWRSAGRIGDTDLWLLDQEAREFMEVCGGCERIRTTLMSRSWRAFVRQCIVIFLAALPWSLVNEFGFWTIPVSVVTCYLVVGGEGIALCVEEPFETTEDHLDLETICEAIRRSVREILKDDVAGS